MVNSEPVSLALHEDQKQKKSPARLGPLVPNPVKNRFLSVLFGSPWSYIILSHLISSCVFWDHPVTSSSCERNRVIFLIAASSQPWLYTSQWIIQAGQQSCRPVGSHSLHHRNWVTLFRCNTTMYQSGKGSRHEDPNLHIEIALKRLEGLRGKQRNPIQLPSTSIIVTETEQNVSSSIS